ncbi:MAG: primosomal protein N' [Bacteroidales bacterium]|nr:primosomal protein N' [Bacteroidales bacterium]
MERITLFADILLPLKLEGVFTYRVPYEWNDAVCAGQRVAVQFGKNRLYSGLVRRVHQQVPVWAREVKYLLSILDEQPIVNEKQFLLWEWIARYYVCSVGEVMNAAMPSALKLTSETKIVLNPLFNGDFQALNEKEYLIAEALQIQPVLTLSDASKIVDQLKILPLIKTLIEKGVILPEEELQERFTPKKELFIRLSEKFQDETTLQQLFDALEKRANKQLEILMSYIALNNNDVHEYKWLTQKEVLNFSRSPAAALKSLIGKDVFVAEERIVSRLPEVAEEADAADIVLNDEQQRCLSEIETAFRQKEVVLLHGVTASGKTELYIKLIDNVLKQGKQVLYLLPEIALTGQIIHRLRRYFGKQVGIYHSKFNENERVEIWNRTADVNAQRYNIILGARSALFLPYENLGLVIVDEEHDASYKQFDPAPRYLARDTAIMLAKMHAAKTLLGSGTPSVESWFNAHSGKFGFAQILKRYSGQELPETTIVDLRQETRQRNMVSHFSSVLIEKIKTSLENKEQVILFHNRRGFAPRLVCETCGWSPECKNCDVSLVYHKQKNALRCHYCGYNAPVPAACPACGSTAIKMESFGTEKVEDELKLILPQAVIERMDLDTTREKNAHHHIITRFEERKIDILIGTQMVTKGLDFSNVTLVGILNADQLLSYPDFRSFERGFQTIVQVSGRAGRAKKRGLIVIQTYSPHHPIIQLAIQQNFESLYANQLQERKNFLYPPYVRLIRLTLKHRDITTLNAAAKFFADKLRATFKNRILGPEFPLIGRIKNLYLKDILIKIEPATSVEYVKNHIIQTHLSMLENVEWKPVRLCVDVEPY